MAGFTLIHTQTETGWLASALSMVWPLREWARECAAKAHRSRRTEREPQVEQTRFDAPRRSWYTANNIVKIMHVHIFWDAIVARAVSFSPPTFSYQDVVSGGYTWTCSIRDKLLASDLLMWVMKRSWGISFCAVDFYCISHYFHSVTFKLSFSYIQSSCQVIWLHRQL